MPDQAYLISHRERPSDASVADTRRRISAAYKVKVIGSSGSVPIDFSQLSADLAIEVTDSLVDCESTSYAPSQPESVKARRLPSTSEYRRGLVPIFYSASDKIDQSDNLLVCFGALAIGQATRSGIPPIGKVIYGEADRNKTIKIAEHLPKTREAIEAIASMCQVNEPPRVVLNKHCPACAFQSRCRALAVEREDLSLLGAMTVKERLKCEEKGISTIAQLSYGYRPRRRRRIKPASPDNNPPAKHDHKLKALAIKKAQIHVVGSPSLTIERTPVFMDVEGMPDRDFYYLIGLRHERRGTPVEQFFWAERQENECDIWRGCLAALKEIDNPQIVHYGAYENRFLKHMRERWKPTVSDAEFVDHLIEASVNLLAKMYGRIYFPTYTNGLKEIARWLGFQWTSPQASGTSAIFLRQCWELTSDDELRRQLVTYVLDDCRATAIVAKALGLFAGTADATIQRNSKP
jgi:predicted RecB family nuclease